MIRPTHTGCCERKKHETIHSIKAIYLQNFVFFSAHNTPFCLYKISSKKLQRCSTKLVMWVPNLGWPTNFPCNKKNRKFEPWYQQQTNFIWKTCFDSSSHHPTIETNYLDIKEPTKIEHITHSIYRFPEELDVFFVYVPFGSIWKMENWLVVYLPLWKYEFVNGKDYPIWNGK